MKRFLPVFLILLFSLGLSVAGDKGPLKIMVDGIEIHLSGQKMAKPYSDLEDDLVRIPLKRAGNLFLIEAVIDGVRGNFIVDLGAPYLVLNSTYFRDYSIDKTMMAGSVTAVTDYVRTTRVSQLNIQGVKYSRLLADVTDLGAIEDKRGIKILGLIGVSLFEDFILDINFPQQQLTIHKSESTIEVESKLLLDIPMKVRNNVLTIKGKINGISLNFSLDSAAEANILHNDLPKEVYTKMRILNSTLLRDANGGATEVLMTMIHGIQINDMQWDEMETLILNLNTMRQAYGLNIQGMMGYPFFASGRMIIDFNASRLHMYQNSGSNN